MATPQFSPAFDGEAHRVRGRYIAVQRLEDGGPPDGGADVIEQPNQSGDDGTGLAPRSGSRISTVGLAGPA